MASLKRMNVTRLSHACVPQSLKSWKQDELTERLERWSQAVMNRFTHIPSAISDDDKVNIVNLLCLSKVMHLEIDPSERCHLNVRDQSRANFKTGFGSQEELNWCCVEDETRDSLDFEVNSGVSSTKDDEVDVKTYYASESFVKQGPGSKRVDLPCQLLEVNHEESSDYEEFGTATEGWSVLNVTANVKTECQDTSVEFHKQNTGIRAKTEFDCQPVGSNKKFGLVGNKSTCHERTIAKTEPLEEDGKVGANYTVSQCTHKCNDVIISQPLIEETGLCRNDEKLDVKGEMEYYHAVCDGDGRGFSIIPIERKDTSDDDDATKIKFESQFSASDSVDALQYSCSAGEAFHTVVKGLDEKTEIDDEGTHNSDAIPQAENEPAALCDSSANTADVITESDDGNVPENVAVHTDSSASDTAGDSSLDSDDIADNARYKRVPKKFVSRGNTLKHRSHKKSNKSLHKCTICNRIFKWINGLKDHLRRHSGDWRYYCTQCQKGYLQRLNFEYHMLTHSGEKPFSCSECPKKYRSKSHLVSHMRSHHETKRKNQAKVKPFSCKVCGKCFSEKYYMMEHTWVHSGTKPFQCQQCGERFSRRSGLRYHKYKHLDGKQFKCDLCSKAFLTSQNLTKHMRTHIETVEPSVADLYECKVCGKRLKNKRNLNNHSKLHLFSEKKSKKSEKPFKCSQKDCKSAFYCQGSLSTHLKVVHTNARPYPCDICGKSFKYKHYVKEHRLRHNKQTKYNCSECEKGFYKQSYLLKHMETHKRK